MPVIHMSIIRKLLLNIPSHEFHPTPHEEPHFRAFVQSDHAEGEYIRVVFGSGPPRIPGRQFLPPRVQGSFVYINLQAVQAVILRETKRPQNPLTPPGTEEERINWIRFLEATEFAQEFAIETERVHLNFPPVRTVVLGQQVPREDSGIVLVSPD